MAKKLAGIAAFGSLMMMLGAWGFQYIGGLAPCELCLWQRWPHEIAIVLGAVVFFWPKRWLALSGGLVVLVGAGIAVYHAGVELKYWAGPDTCTGLPSLTGPLTVDDLFARPVVHCDDIAWSFLGISMAGWNAITSLGLAALWFLSFNVSGQKKP